MYRSPIRLTGFKALQQEHMSPRSALLLARRKMEAEFELADSSTITFGGQELNRQEVLSLFDELKDEQRLAWHLAIYEDAALLCFLEEGLLQPDSRWHRNPLYADSRFLQFISPHFAAATDAFYRKLLAGGAPLEALHTLAGNESLMLGTDAERAFRYVTRYFLEKKNELLRLQQRAEASEAILKGEVKDTVPDTALSVLNCLPDTYNYLRYQTANALNNLCVAFDRKNYKRHALIAIEKAAQVSVADEELQTLIPRNLNIIRSKQTGSFFKVDENGRKQPKWGIIVGLILMLIRFSGCLFSDDNSATGPIDIRNFPSAEELRARLQPQPLQTFNSLVAALTGGAPDSFRYQMALQRYSVTRPLQTGELVFPELQSKEFGDGAADSSAAGRQQTLLVRNRSSWHLLLCYTMDDKRFFIRYVAPGDAYPLHYRARLLQATLVAGKDWNADRRYIFNSYASGLQPEIRAISGGYRQVPDNIRMLVSEERGPVYINADTTGAVRNETLEVADSTGNTISVRTRVGSGTASTASL